MSRLGHSSRIFRPNLRSRRSLLSDLNQTQISSTVIDPPNHVTTTSTSLACLPLNVLTKIYSRLDLTTLGNLGLVSKSLADTVIEFLEQDSVSSMLFPSCIHLGIEEEKTKYIIRGSQRVYTMNSSNLASNCRSLGLMIKRVSMVKPTSIRLSLAYSVMHRISLIVASGSNKELMTGFGIYFHSFTRGWRSDESEAAARMISSHNMAEIQSLLQEEYIFGSNPILEITVRNFLRAFFVDVEKENRLSWLLAMVRIFVPFRESEKVGKLLCLASAPLKEARWLEGIQWKDNMEAVPACVKVANYRYQELVKIILNLERLGGYQGSDNCLMKVLSVVFRTPQPWLPENKASFLILSGPRITRQYLAYLVNQAVQCNRMDPPITRESFNLVGDVLLGLFLMQSRFRRSMELIYIRLDELIPLLPSSARKPFFNAVWGSISREMVEVREGVEDDWAKDSSFHIYSVIRTLGLRLTVKGFLNRENTERMDTSEIED
ncbi:F-box only protein 47 isoform X2 [Eurytemora carolleeae]|uniref:F-box only protein 47 isoform X2 n=1 Tax=Eurytemora carolleeae TaxID=1294199 RepID=UPI000C78A0F8|nr:F-box only protein 47 isoform X2 [Eurytemora carolleeae]|eukprot:XP_023336818.1 F-box only protein 47-like isoform X2 [Eurytemora affinis]